MSLVPVKAPRHSRVARDFCNQTCRQTLAGIGERLPRWRMDDQANATWLFRWSGPPPPPRIPKIRKPRKRRCDAGISTIWHVHIPEGLLPESVDIGAIYGDVGENPTVRSLYQRLRDADPASSSAAGGADPTPDCGAHAEHPDAGMQTQVEDCAPPNLRGPAMNLRGRLRQPTSRTRGAGVTMPTRGMRTTSRARSKPRRPRTLRLPPLLRRCRWCPATRTNARHLPLQAPAGR